MGKLRKKYSKEFKLDAVRLVVEKGRSARQVALSLGINESMLHQWKRRALEEGEAAFPGNGRPAANELEDEVRRLRKELADVKQDREILKKAAAYFARNQS